MSALLRLLVPGHAWSSASNWLLRGIARIMSDAVHTRCGDTSSICGKPIKKERAARDRAQLDY